MFLVECRLVVKPPEALTDDEITDIIEVIVDRLDSVQGEPSVGTCRLGQALEMTVSVVVLDDHEFAAMQHGLGLIRDALHAAGLSPEGPAAPHDVRSAVTEMAGV